MNKKYFFFSVASNFNSTIYFDVHTPNDGSLQKCIMQGYATFMGDVFQANIATCDGIVRLFININIGLYFEEFIRFNKTVDHHCGGETL